MQRYPELKDDFTSIQKVCNPDEKPADDGKEAVRLRAAAGYLRLSAIRVGSTRRK